MKIQSNYPLAWFKDELYYFPERKQIAHVKTPQMGARYIPSRKVKGKNAWRISRNGYLEENARQKKILLCDHRFEPSKLEDSRLSLLINLIQEGFEISILTKNRSLVKIDPRKIYNATYLSNLLGQAQFFPNTFNGAESEGVTRLKSCGEQHPEEAWYCLDNYAAEKILYAYHHGTPTHSPLPNFKYGDSDGFLSWADIRRGVDMHHPQFLEFIPREKLEHVILNGEKPLQEIISNYSIMKSLSIRNSIYDLNFLEQELYARKIENLSLSITSGKLPDFEKLTKLKNLELSGKGIKSLRNLPSLPKRTLESLSLFNCNCLLGTEFNSSFSPVLKKLQLNNATIQILSGVPDSLESLAVTACQSLETIDLEASNLKDLMLDISQLKRISVPLTLEKLTVSSLDLDAFKSAEFPNLKSIYLIEIPNKKLDLNLPDGLKELTLSRCESLEDLSALENCRDIEKINIENCELLTDLDFKACQQLKKMRLFKLLSEAKLSLPSTLEELELTYSPHLTLDLSSLTNLKKLTIDYDQIAKLPPNILHNLEELEIVVAKELDHKPLLDLAGMACLKKLTINDKEACMWDIRHWPPKLSELSLTNKQEDKHGNDTIPDPFIDTCPPGVKIKFNAHKVRLKTTVSAQQATYYTQPETNTLKEGAHLESKNSDQPLVRHVIYEKKPGSRQPRAVHFSKYREHIKNQLQSAEGRLSFTAAPFRKPSEHEQPPDLKQVAGFSETEIAHHLEQGHYVGVFPLCPRSEWVSLPTLAPGDSIIALSKPPDCQLRYNLESGQHEILWAGDNANAQVQYVFAPRKEKSDIKESYSPADRILPQEIENILDRLICTEEFPLSELDNANFITLLEVIGPFLSQLPQDSPEKNSPEKDKFYLETLPELFRKFDWKTPLIESDTHKIPRWAEALLQWKGACDDRTFISILIYRYLGIPARRNVNVNHANPEIYLNGRWHRIELSGAPEPIKPRWEPQPIHYKTKEEKKSPEPITQRETKHETKQTIAYEKRDWRPYFSPFGDAKRKLYAPDKKLEAETVLNDLLETPRALVEVPDLKTGRALYAALKKQMATTTPDETIVYIESTQDIEDQWKIYKVESNGEVNPYDGPLHDLITQGQGTAVFQWGGRFGATDIASPFLGINDPKHPTFAGMQISPKLKIVNLVTPQVQMSDRFHSRCQQFVWPQQLSWPDPLNDLMPKESLPERKEKGEDKGELPDEAADDQWLVADMPEDPERCKELLLGTIDLESSRYVYVPGLLQQMISSGKRGIRLIGAPWDNSEFQRFVLELRLNQTASLNGKEEPLPIGFKIEEIPTPKMEPLPSSKVSSQIWQPDSKTRDIFYLNQQNFDALQKTYVMKDGEVKGMPGWLDRQPSSEEAQRKKQLVLTEPLSPYQQRTLLKLLAAHKDIEWVDLSQLPQAEEVKCTTLTDVASELQSRQGSTIVTSEDPYFVAQTICPGATIIPIHAETTPEELLEKYIEQGEAKETQKQSGLTRIEGAVTKALAQDDNPIVLYGPLSHNLYTALESLHSQNPELQLCDAADPKPMRGRLVVVSPPLHFTPTLAMQQQRYNHLPPALWEDYEKQLKTDFPDEPRLKPYLEKIRQFYQLAEQVTHGQVGTPPLLRLSYQRLRNFFSLLQDKEWDDNPIKVFFHHDYDHHSETYAYLNVVAKYLFGKTALEDKKAESPPKPGVRRYKLEEIPPNAAYLWRQLNCLDANAIQQMLQEGELQTFYQEPQTGFSRLLDWMETTELHDIKPNDDSPTKVWQRLEQALTKHAVVTLKGEPGTGKTYAALKYANDAKNHRTAFVGKHHLKAWLSIDPAMGSESVLVIDEANLSAPGTWDFLLPLLNKKPGEAVSIWYEGEEYPLSDRHKVIFTCNPESYPGRDYHAILQDSLQLYVKGWTRKTLKQHIVEPLLRDSIKDEKAIAQTQTIENLLTALQRVCHILATPHANEWSLPLHQETAPVTNEHISLRDIQQLLTRWTHRVSLITDRSGESYAQAAYEACYLEWGHHFRSEVQKNAFKLVLESLFQPMHTQIQDFSGYQQYQTIAQKLASDLYLTQKQQEWLFTIKNDYDLAQQGLLNTVDQTPLAKTGTLLEGGSGIGKTSLFIALAEAMNLTPISTDALLQSEQTDLSNRYIHFIPTGKYAEDRLLLLKAFHCGCKVIIDELNLDPSLESMLNQLLTGKTPGGKQAKIPGFYVFASQNSRNSKGNKASSFALKNRFHVLQPELNKNDLVNIADIALTPKISASTLRKQIAYDIVEDYEEMRQTYPDFVNIRTFMEGSRCIASDITPNPSLSQPPLSDDLSTSVLQSSSFRRNSHGSLGGADSFFKHKGIPFSLSPHPKRERDTPEEKKLIPKKDVNINLPGLSSSSNSSSSASSYSKSAGS